MKRREGIGEISIGPEGWFSLMEGKGERGYTVEAGILELLSCHLN